MRKFFAELKRRKVYRVAVAYAVGAWLVAQIVTQIFPIFEVSQWALRLMIVLLVAGFPIALILSWAFDITPQGIKRTEDVDPFDYSSGQVLIESRAHQTGAAVPEKSIAVLPFENLSDDQQNTYFADGIQDDILSTLAKVADLKVISRTSVRQYRGTGRNLREIGTALGVAHILEGTVRRAGDRVRVVAQLINARTDAHIWSDTFDREVTDLFALQSELAEQIAAALRANISAREKASIQIHPTKDMAAYDLFLRARDLFRWSGVGDPLENGEKAIRLVDQAVARDPRFAQAYALASRLNAELYWFGHDRSRARLTKARTAADIALRLQPELGDAHLALAFFHYLGYRDYERARTGIEIAQRATPNDAEVWDAGGAVDRRAGRWEEAIANFEKARYLDPRNFSVISNLAETLIAMRRYPEAQHAIDNALLVNPNAHLFSIARASIDLKKSGDTAPLRAALRAMPRDFDPGGAVTTVGIRLSLMEHDFAEAARMLAASSQDRFTDSGFGGTAGMIDGYTFPESWYEGLVERAQGNIDTAQHAFEAAGRVVAADLAQWPDDVKAIMMLALIHGALGRKEDALREGGRAVELLPISKDAYDGPILATNLAAIYAQLGERELALKELTRLVTLPNGPTPGLLRIEPEWDPLRGDSRFEKLATDSGSIATAN
jgi:TolB-like protein/Flp pilus assembly protein TadD